MASKQDAEIKELEKEVSKQKSFGFTRAPGTPKYSNYIKIRTRNPNKPRRIDSFKRYSKDDITRFLSDPRKFQKELREAVIYMYTASTHFYRIVQYFAGLSDLAYVVSPYKIDPKTANDRTISNNYRKVLNLLSSMSIKTQIPKILTVCIREDTFYGTLWISDESIIIQQLPFKYCAITTIEDNVFNITFDMTYFDIYPEFLEYYPLEFRTKYEMYKSRQLERWVELDSPTSFAIKCNKDIMDYSVPPLAGILREIYDIEDYKNLKLSKTALENYAMIAMELPMDSDGNWMIDYDKATGFYFNLEDVLPEEIGSVLTPMEVSKISFEKSNTGDVDTISEAEQNLFTSAGVSSLLFNNESASANALLLSIKADQNITFGIVKSVEDMINRLIHSYKYGRNFKVTFLDCSTYNRDSLGSEYLKACQYGIPMVSYYAASQGLSQAELDSMSYLETDIMKLQEVFKPLISSTNATADQLDSVAATDEGGAPEKSIEELTDSGEESREDKDDWG